MKLQAVLFTLATAIRPCLSRVVLDYEALRVAPYPIVSNHLPIERQPSSSRTSSAHLKAEMLEGQASLIAAGVGGQDLLANITLGSQSFSVLIDTGSSDTWVIQHNFTCVNGTTGTEITASSCGFGSAGFVLDNTISTIPDENFMVTYGDGDTVEGILGTTTVTVANITVANQEIALVASAAWTGDGISSGLAGFAYPQLTNAYPGLNVSTDNRTKNDLPYSPLINTMFFKENVTKPIFALAISRDSSQIGAGGVMTIGGIPDLGDASVNASHHFVRAPIEPTSLAVSEIPNALSLFTFYTITANGLAYLGKSKTLPVQWIIDSGSTLLFAPSEDAKAINALFSPAAVLDPQRGYYEVLCNATAPSVGVNIAGRTFDLNPTDLILGSGSSDNICVSGIKDGGDGPFILGDVFLKNVLAVFDVGQSEMAFSARPVYES